MRIEPSQRSIGALHLEPADIMRAVQDLTVQVRQRHDIVVDDRKTADAGASEILQNRRAQTARADNENASVLQLVLARAADPMQDDLAGIALDFFARKFHAEGNLAAKPLRRQSAREDNAMIHDPVVIVSAARTPMGGFLGDFKDTTAAELGATAIRAALERAGLMPGEIEEVLFGCVLSAGQGQAPARQAALGAGVPVKVGCTTINKMCGSGMKAAMLAHDALLAGTANIVVAGGMESMSNAPYLAERARTGYRMGHGRLLDHMFLDGLEDAYDKGRLMGTFAEDCAEAYQFTRQAQDAFAIASLERAQRAMIGGAFASEIAPLDVRVGKGDRRVEHDEQPPKARLDKIPDLKPAFRKDGTVTAANSS
jgi:hypothetical protein